MKRWRLQRHCAFDLPDDRLGALKDFNLNPADTSVIPNPETYTLDPPLYTLNPAYQPVDATINHNSEPHTPKPCLLPNTLNLAFNPTP